jgi:hypothetical protein
MCPKHVDALIDVVFAGLEQRRISDPSSGTLSTRLAAAFWRVRGRLLYGCVPAL